MLNEFFNSYKQAFEKTDQDDILKHYSFPCFIRHEQQNYLFEEDSFAINIKSLLNSYKQHHFQTASFAIKKAEELTENILQVFVDWELLDNAKVVFSRFSCIYQLTRNENNNLAIFAVLNINEVIKRKH